MQYEKLILFSNGPQARLEKAVLSVPLRCWHARGALVLTLLTVVERLLAAEGEAPLVEFEQMSTRVFHALALWSKKSRGRAAAGAGEGNADEVQLLLFGLGLVGCILPALTERAEEFGAIIELGVGVLLVLVGRKSGGRWVDVVAQATRCDR
jgi:hypothetical protein